MTKEYIGGTLVMVLCILGAALVFLRYLRRLANSRAAANWPTAQATILESRQVRTVSSQGSRGLYPQIRYRYRVGDAEFTSERVSYDALPQKRADMANLVLTYPKGSTHPVRYNPRRPSHAMLAIAAPTRRPLFLLPILLTIAALAAYLRNF